MGVLRSKWVALTLAIAQAFLVVGFFVPAGLRGELWGWLAALILSCNVVFNALDVYDGFRARRQ